MNYFLDLNPYLNHSNFIHIQYYIHIDTR